MSRYFLVVALCAVVIGCTAQDLAQLQSTRDQTVAEINQAVQSEAALKQQAAALPASDPVRTGLDSQLSKLDALIARGQQYLPILDAAIHSAQSASIDPSIQSAVAAIPYGSLALAVAGIVWGLVKHLQAGKTLAEGEQVQTAFAQMVKALDAALPQPSDQQTAAIASVLDTDAKARAALVRST